MNLTRSFDSETVAGGLTSRNLTAAHAGVPDGHPLTFDGKPVMTTDMLASAFGATPKNILDNFQNNGPRFEEGGSHIRVSGAELKALKDSPDFIGVVPKNAPTMILWTQRGVFRHAKILETDAAWAAYEELEDTYFASQESVVRALSPAEMFLHNAQAMVAIERKQIEHGQALVEIGSKVDQIEAAQTVLSSRPSNSEAMKHIRKRIGKKYGLSEVTINEVIRQVSYAPKPAGTVRNNHADAEGATYAVYWQKDITSTFRQFAAECSQVTATMWTHPQIEGRFKMNPAP